MARPVLTGEHDGLPRSRTRLARGRPRRRARTSAPRPGTGELACRHCWASYDNPNRAAMLFWTMFVVGLLGLGALILRSTCGSRAGGAIGSKRRTEQPGPRHQPRPERQRGPSCAPDQAGAEPTGAVFTESARRRPRPAVVVDGASWRSSVGASDLLVASSAGARRDRTYGARRPRPTGGDECHDRRRACRQDPELPSAVQRRSPRALTMTRPIVRAGALMSSTASGGVQ